MATVTERLDSRQGGKVGADGFEPPVGRYHIRLASIAEDPLFALAAAVPFGSAHPQSRFSLAFAASYGQPEMIEPDYYIGEVFYRLPAALPTGFGTGIGWKFQMRSEPRQLILDKDLDGKPLRIPAYTPRIIAGNIVYTADIYGNVDVPMTQSGSFKPIPMEITTEDYVIVLSTTTPLMSIDKIQRIVAARRSVNLNTFFAPPGHAKLTSVAVDEAGGGLDETGFDQGWNVTLNFLLSEFKFSPVTFAHSFTDDDGNISPIMSNNAIVVDTFRLANAADYAALLTGIR